MSCIMPTADRRPWIRRAIGCFLRQDHPARELVVIDDGDDRVADLIPPDPRIRYYGAERRRVLGAKRNAACELARGDVIVHWDDDDWNAPHRISYEVEQLARAGADVCGSSRLLYLDPVRRAAWLYEHPPRDPPWVGGNTLCYTAEAWARAPFPELAVAEDFHFLESAGRRVHAVGDHRFLVGMVHAANAAPKHTASAWWHPRPLGEVEQVLGVDAAAYLLDARAR